VVLGISGLVDFTDPVADGIHMPPPVDPAFDDRGLLPAIVQDSATGTVLMVAWMNAEALRKTRDSGVVHFYSRSRKTLWQKGETSGNTLHVEEIRIDCDADAVLVRARPAGPVCHTGKTGCFYRVVDPAGEHHEDEGVPPSTDARVLDRLARTIEARKASTAEKSYTKSLLDGGIDRVLEKIAEEHAELAEDLVEGATEGIVHEAADLIFHVMVGLASRGVDVSDVWRELEKRTAKSGHEEKAER
jgi:phosphoribosyl-ATP pyrophosphohydrolase/phosphoribosyl-AMP cyclohydrolase